MERSNKYAADTLWKYMTDKNPENLELLSALIDSAEQARTDKQPPEAWALQMMLTLHQGDTKVAKEAQSRIANFEHEKEANGPSRPTCIIDNRPEGKRIPGARRS